MYGRLFKGFIFPIAEFYSGTSIQKYLNLLNKTQWWEPEQLEELQNKKLRALVKYAYDNVPYYHKLFRETRLKPRDIKTVNDLQKLPILTKDKIRKNFSELQSKDFKKWKAWLNSTSGSTGEPLKYYVTIDNASIGWASGFRGFEWAGYRLGDKRATLAGSSLIPTEKPKFSKRIRWLLERNLPLSAVNMTKEKMDQYVDELRQYKPKFIRGYASALYVFANHLKEESIEDIRPKAIFTTAEMLCSNHRKFIEEQFGCQVFDGYGCNDSNVAAMECSEHNGYHISTEQVIIEFINNNEKVSLGERGDIISTDLHNYAMPFIRYKVGDVGILSDEKCVCGRGLSLMTSIEGRTTDMIIFDNGVILSGPALTLIFKYCDIKQYQVIQETKNKLLIKIVKGGNYSEKDTNHILGIINSHVGEDVNIEMEFVDDIPTTKSGKYRFIISKVSSNYK